VLIRRRDPVVGEYGCVESDSDSEVLIRRRDPVVGESVCVESRSEMKRRCKQPPAKGLLTYRQEKGIFSKSVV
jgi:hypothetical protein